MHKHTSLKKKEARIGQEVQIQSDKFCQIACNMQKVFEVFTALKHIEILL